MNTDKMLFWGGTAFAAVSAILTFQYLNETHFAMACAGALMAFLIPHLWPRVSDAYRSRRYITTAILGLGAVSLFSVDILTNLGSIAWRKTADVTVAEVHNIKFEDSRKAVASREAEIEQFEGLIADLKKANPWITTVSADGLKGNIPALEEAIRQEANRGGCGPKCLGLKEELASLQDRIGKAEALDGHTKKLIAARNALALAQSKAAEKNVVVSGTKEQDVILAKLGTLSLEPDTASQGWSQLWISVVLAFLFAFAGPVLVLASDYKPATTPRRSAYRAPETAKETGLSDSLAEVLNRARGASQGRDRTIFVKADKSPVFRLQELVEEMMQGAKAA